MNTSSQSSARVVRLLGILLLLGTVAAPVALAQVNFSMPPTYLGGGSVFVADSNGDGKPDILTGDGPMNLGNGDGTFTPGTPVVGGALAVADFNGDGKADVLQQACKFSPSSISNASGAASLTISTTGPTALLAPVLLRPHPLHCSDRLGIGFVEKKAAGDTVVFSNDFSLAVSGFMRRCE
jgi:hypothetical protein